MYMYIDHIIRLHYLDYIQSLMYMYKFCKVISIVYFDEVPWSETSVITTQQHSTAIISNHLHVPEAISEIVIVKSFTQNWFTLKSCYAWVHQRT